MRWTAHTRTAAFVPLLAGAVLFAGAASAQTTSLDEGSFVLLLDGQEVGTETFSIRQSGTGADAVIIARGTVTIDTANVVEEIRSTLRAVGTSMRPAAYQAQITGATTREIAGRVVGNRFSARIRSSTGEQMREYLASDGAVLIDDGVAHHHYFIGRRATGSNAAVPIIIPRQNRQVSATVEDRGSSTVEVADQTVNARQLVVTPAGAQERYVWVDDRGHVLRVEVPSRRFAAVRRSLPR